MSDKYKHIAKKVAYRIYDRRDQTGKTKSSSFYDPVQLNDEQKRLASPSIYLS